MQTVACPPTEQLKAYLSGKLDESASDVLAQHLLDCQACERTAVELEQEPDTLVELLQEDTSAAEPSQPPTAHEVAVNSNLLQFPQVLGQYELRTRLGTGGMGAVYLGRHKSLDKQVAIKLLPVLPAQNTEFVARFQREMRAAGKLDHPAIVRTTDAGEHHGIHYLVMDAIDGMDLGRLVRVEDKLSVADACEMARQAAVGLAHAHEKGIVHRDVKPSNLMLDASGQIRILDFGLAQIGFWESGSAEITTVGQLMGTLDYMAPEQAERGGAVDYRADLYSLGATLFRLLTGRAPLAAAPNLTPLEKLRLLATHRPPKLRSLRPDAPEALSEIVDAMLSREPSQRPASAIHAAELLEPFGAESDLSGLLQRARSKPVVDEPSFVLNPLLQRDLAEWRSGSAATPSDVAMKATRPAPLIASESNHNGSQRSNRWNRWTTWVVAAGFFAMLWGGIVLVLETSKGQLVIDSEADVQVKIVAVDEGGQRAEVEQLQIEPGTQATRLKSGKYEITIDAGSDSIGVTNGSFTIQRGQTVVATITQKGTTTAQAATPAVPSVVAPEDPRLNQIVFGNETLDTWLRKLEFERSPAEIARALIAIQELASDDLQDVIRDPLVRFAQRSKSSELHGEAILALKECCGEKLHEAVGQIVSAHADEKLRLEVLSWSMPHIVSSGISTLRPDSLFMTEALRLLESRAPNVSLVTALHLRCLMSEFSHEKSNRDIQSFLLDRFSESTALTNENFWLAYPGAEYTSPSGVKVKAVTSIIGTIANRSVAALADTSTSVTVKTQAKIVLRSLVEAGVELSTPQREQVEQTLAQEFAHAAENLELCAVDVELRRGFELYVAPKLTTVVFSPEASRNSTKANALIQTMHLAIAADLKNGLQNELQALFDTLHASSLFDPAVARYFRGPNEQTWSELLGRYSRREPSYLPRRALYLQAGTMLGKSQDELLARLELKLPADIDFKIERQLDEIRDRAVVMSESALDDLYHLPIENNAAVVQVLESLFSDSELFERFKQNSRRKREWGVWMKAAGDDFPASYARVLEKSSGEHRLGLLNIDLTAFPDFQCIKSDALKQLLVWCERTLQADAQQEYSAAITGMLSRLVTDKPCNSVVCQRMVVERLESFAFLTDQDFWLSRPFQFSNRRTIMGPPMRQAVLKRAFAHVAKSSDADDALLCQALAIVRQGLESWDEVPQPMQVDAIEQIQKRLVAAAEKPDAQTELHSLPDSFAELTYPTFVGVQLTSADLSRTNVNAMIMMLNLLTAARESNAQRFDQLRPTVQALHESIEQRNLMGRQLSRWDGSRWENILHKAGTSRDLLLLHTWYMQTGGLLGHDVNTLRERPAKLDEEERERKRRFIQPRDTLAIHIPGLLPQSGDPPVLQAGTSTPVVGFPVPVSSDGTIQLPLLEPLRVTELDLAQVQAEIDAQYVGKKLLKSDSPRGISVQFLLRAGEGLEIRNVAGNTSVTIPEK
jgi:serine/threonine protein kinase